MSKVLLVGDDDGRIAGIEDALGDTEVLRADSTKAAAAVLESDSDVRVLVADGATEGVDPFQLALGARESAPTVQMYVLTEHDAEALAPINDHCVVQYAARTADPAAIAARVTDMVQAIADARSPVEDLELLDIIVLACLAGRTAVLYVRHDEHKGRVIFRDGAIPHAEFGDRRGADALYEMLALQQGDIFMQNHIDGTYETTIEEPPVSLLGIGLGELEERRVRWAEQSQAESRLSITDSDIHSLMGMGVEEEEDEHAVSFFSAEELAEIEELEHAAASISEPVSHSLLQARPSTSSSPALATPIAQHSGSAWNESGAMSGVPLANSISAGVPVSIPAGIATPPPPPPAQRSADPILPSRPALRVTPPGPRMTTLPPSAPTASLHELLDRMQFEIPGFVSTDIVHRGDGLGVATLHTLDAYDSAAAAAYYCDFLNSCVNAVHGYGAAADLEEVVVSTNAHHIILRPLTGTPFVHMCVVTSDGNLGIAKVVLRRYAALLSLALPH
jgi:hypothetical protein